MTSVVNALQGVAGGPDRVLTTALLLNIALMLFGWRRYRDLAAEVVERTQAEERAQLLAAKDRSEEHTSELQSLMRNLVCRLLLEKKNKNTTTQICSNL